MKVGDLVMYKYDLAHQHLQNHAPVGIVAHVDPEKIGGPGKVLVMWNDEDGLANHSTEYLEVISESR